MQCNPTFLLQPAYDAESHNAPCSRLVSPGLLSRSKAPSSIHWQVFWPPESWRQTFLELDALLWLCTGHGLPTGADVLASAVPSPFMLATGQWGSLPCEPQPPLQPLSPSMARGGAGRRLYYLMSMSHPFRSNLVFPCTLCTSHTRVPSTVSRS